MTDNKNTPDFPETQDKVEHTVDNPTEPLDQPAGSAGGTDHPPAGYFTNPSAPLAQESPAETEALAGTDTPAKDNPSAVPQSKRLPARVGTIVWGAVVLVAGVLLILVSQLDLGLNAGLTAIWLLLGAGVAMLAGGAANLLQRR